MNWSASAARIAARTRGGRGAGQVVTLRRHARPVRRGCTRTCGPWRCNWALPGAALTRKAQGYGAEPVTCEVSGTDRAEYLGHMRRHSVKLSHGTKLIKLKRKAPAATLPNSRCPRSSGSPGAVDHCARRARPAGHYRDGRGAGSSGRPGRSGAPCWVIPLGAAAWEDGRAAPVLVYGGPGRASSTAVRGRAGTYPSRPDRLAMVRHQIITWWRCHGLPGWPGAHLCRACR